MSPVLELVPFVGALGDLIRPSLVGADAVSTVGEGKARQLVSWGPVGGGAAAHDCRLRSPPAPFQLPGGIRRLEGEEAHSCGGEGVLPGGWGREKRWKMLMRKTFFVRWMGGFGACWGRVWLWLQNSFPRCRGGWGWLGVQLWRRSLLQVLLT